MKLELTMTELGRSRIGSVSGTGPILRYRVVGMPPGQEAQIANFGNANKAKWRILRIDEKPTTTGEESF